MKNFLLAISLAALVSVPAAATTYYVSSSGGSDSNSGTSSSLPWKTLGKVNATALAPGDQVLLNRGDTWRESLIPYASGNSASSIYFDAYGSGPAPSSLVTRISLQLHGRWFPEVCGRRR